MGRALHGMVAALAFAALFQGIAVGEAEPRRDVVVLVNADVPASIALGEYYAKKRGIPATEICCLHTAAGEVISWPDLRKTILEPLRAFLKTRPDVLYLVPTFGVPVKTSEEHPENDAQGAPGDTVAQCVTGRDYACIDRELELLRQEHEIEGWLQSKTFNVERPITVADGIYIVSRLDGPTPELARALIDNALFGETYGVAGVCLIDTRGLKDGGYFQPDEDMRKIADVFKQHGLECHHDDVEAVVPLGTFPNPSHYWGWYAGDIQAKPEFRFNRGAVGAHLHSFSAGVLRSPDKTWVGPLVAHGITGTCGTVYEPLASGFPYGVIFMDRFLAGHNFGQSMQMANLFTSWMAVFVGDPLYAPYAEGRKEAQERNRALAKDGPARVAKNIDAGDLDAAQQDADALAALPVPPDGAGDLSFPLRELRARRLAKKPATGTLAELRAIVEDLAKEADPKKQLALARKGLALSEGNFECSLVAGRLQLAEGGARPAQEAFTRALAVEPASGPALLGLGLAQRDLKDLDAARATLASAYAADGNPDAARALGEILVKLGKHDEAVSILTPVFARNPGDRGVALLLAEEHLALKAADQVTAILEPLAERPPESPDDVEPYCGVWEALLKAYRLAGDKTKADAAGKVAGGFAARRKSAWAKPKAAPVQQAVDKVEGDKKFDPLPNLLTYDEPASGLPTLYLCNRGEWEVDVEIVGPLVFKTGFRGIKGATKLNTQALPLWPGKYRIVVAAKRGSESKVLFGAAVVERNKDYSLAFNKDLSLYRADKP